MSLTPKITGRTRHRVANIGGFLGFGRKQVLILQYEVRGFVPEWLGNSVAGETKEWWVDAKPEWEMMVQTAAAKVAFDSTRNGEY